MPEAIIFAPCERVIVEQGSNAITLVSLMQELVPSRPTDGAELPENALSAQHWYVMTLWARLPSDDPAQELESKIEMLNPRGVSLLDGRSTFRMQKARHRHVATVTNFPIGVVGQYHLRLYVRAVGTEAWIEKGHYGLFVKAPGSHGQEPTE